MMRAAYNPEPVQLRNLSAQEKKQEQIMSEYLISDKAKIILTDRRIIFSSHATEESVALSKVSTVKVAFNRSIERMAKGILLILACLIFMGIWKDVESYINHQIAKIERKFKDFNSKITDVKPTETQEGYIDIPLALIGLLSLPLIIMGGYGIYAGWRGETALVIKNFSNEIKHIASGRDIDLIQFGQTISQRLI